MRVDGTPKKITDNTYDDDAPAIDPKTGDVVWHALINDRYQIMYYKRTTGLTTKMTNDSFNSMQPAIYDGAVVFQSWIGNNWEIALIDTDGARTVLTDTPTHNIAPSINADYITWQAREGETWVAKVYDRKTKNIETVKGVDGGKVENARMVLVYDNKTENGDVQTMGYDPAKGVTVPLTATPASLPNNVPVPESQKNVPVFVQPTTTPKIEVKIATTPGSGDPLAGTGSTTPDIGVTNATSTAATTTPAIPDVTIATSTARVATSTLPVAPILDLTSGTSTLATSTIPDLVVPAFNATTDATSTAL